MNETEKLIERMMDFIDDDYVSYFPMNNNTKKRPVNKNTFNNVNKKKISVVDEAAHNFIEELCFKLKEKTIQNQLLQEQYNKLLSKNEQDAINNNNHLLVQSNKQLAMRADELTKIINNLMSEKQHMHTILDHNLKEINTTSIIMNNNIMKQYNDLSKVFETNRIFINNILNICETQIIPLLDINVQQYFKNILINQICLINS